MFYRIGPGNIGTYDARIGLTAIDEMSTAVTLYSQGGGTDGRPPRNTAYSLALRQVLARLLAHPGSITRVLIDSDPSRKRFNEAQRVLFTGEELSGLSVAEATSRIRVALRRFDQKPGTKGGNSTKQLRIETAHDYASIRSTLHVTHWDKPVVAIIPTTPQTPSTDAEPDLPAALDRAIADLPASDEDRRYAEGDPRMVDHLRIERRRNAAAVRDKRAAMRAANGGRLACEDQTCKIDWYTHYTPAVAERIFDIHHTVPLSEMHPDHETRIEDLRCLCANCHRAEHRRMSLAGVKTAPNQQ